MWQNCFISRILCHVFACDANVCVRMPLVRNWHSSENFQQQKDEREQNWHSKYRISHATFIDRIYRKKWAEFAEQSQWVSCFWGTRFFNIYKALSICISFAFCSPFHSSSVGLDTVDLCVMADGGSGCCVMYIFEVMASVLLSN